MSVSTDWKSDDGGFASWSVDSPCSGTPPDVLTVSDVVPTLEANSACAGAKPASSVLATTSDAITGSSVVVLVSGSVAAGGSGELGELGALVSMLTFGGGAGTARCFAGATEPTANGAAGALVGGTTFGRCGGTTLAWQPVEAMFNL